MSRTGVFRCDPVTVADAIVMAFFALRSPYRMGIGAKAEFVRRLFNQGASTAYAEQSAYYAGVQ